MSRYHFKFTRSDDAECRAITYMHVFGPDGLLASVSISDAEMPQDALLQMIDDLRLAREIRRVM